MPKRQLSRILIAAVFLVPFAPGRASAVDRTCTISGTMSLMPGLGTEPSSGTFSEGSGELGTIDCGYGHSGTFAMDGHYGSRDPDTCTGGGEGWGVQSFTVNGVNTKNPFTFGYGGASGAGGTLSGRFYGDVFSGAFDLIPVEGDCTSTRVTKARLSGKGIWKD